jgi:hypothetical protein
MSALRRSAALAALLALAACSAGQNSPTAPTSALTAGPTAPATPSSWSLAGQVLPTHGPVLSGVQVEFGSGTAQTNGAGRFSMTHQNGASSGLMAVTHPGLLERRLWLRGGQTRSDLDLDPIALTAPFDLTFYRQFARDDRDSPGRLSPLRRWTTAPKFYVQTVDDFGDAVDSATVHSTIEGIVAGVTQLTPFGHPVIETGTAPREPARGWVRILFKRWTASFNEGGICGQAFVGADPGEIRLWLDRCRCSGDPGRVSTHLVLHEVGHAMGFWHVDGRHVMQPFVGCGPGERTSSALERFHAALVYRRPVGNIHPDTDPSSALSSTAGGALPPALVSCGA